MLESFPVALLVATLLGCLSGLGIGGGSLLILWLTLVLKVDAIVARQINLLFFLPAALIACLFRWKQGAVPPRIVLPALLAGCAAGAVCTFLGTALDTSLLKRLFGLLLLFTGLRELLYRPKT